MPSYFIKLNGEDTFDKVTAEVFANRNKCVQADGQTPRYDDAWVECNGTVKVHGEFSRTMLGSMMRMLEVSPPIVAPSPIFDEPESVIMVERGRLYRFDLADGSKWRKEPPKAA